MALDPIAITVREGDSFDELHLILEKPWGTPYDYSSSVLVADIRRFFNDSTSPTSPVDSFGIVETDPTKGKLALKLTSKQTEALGRNVPLGYEDRGIAQSGISTGVDPSDELQGPFLWDLREYFTVQQATISSISQGASFTSTGGVTANRVRVVTTAAHGLTSKDQIQLSGTGLTVYDSVNFYANDLQIINNTTFEIIPTTSGVPSFTTPATQGSVFVYKEDTHAVGTLEVIPRISRDTVS
jgi:hypothetical protein